MEPLLFPFTAILGQDDMKLALILNVIDPRIGGVLLSGHQGTGKSTAVRSLINILPEILVNDGCQFQCRLSEGTQKSTSKENLEFICEYCSNPEIEHQIISKHINLINLPLGATEEMIIGTLDIQKIIKEGTRAIQPGLLAKAHRGILYVDEINLLQDHLVDILLDVSASGINIIEREGVSLAHPSEFILIGSMNPEEGELRPQISDRLGIEVHITAPTDPIIRAKITQRVIAFDDNPLDFIEKYAQTTRDLKDRIISAQKNISEIQIPKYLYEFTARLILEVGLYSQRADITFIRCARAHAAFCGRTKIEKEDLEKSINLVFQHRVKRFNHDIPLDQIHQKFLELFQEYSQNEI